MFLLPVFDYQFEVAAPLRAVSDFHHDTRVLKHLTPPPVIIQMRRFDPMGAGSVSEFTMWFGLLPVNWIVVHSDVNPLQGFTDTQQKGPLLAWQHTHSFSAKDEFTTHVHEHIEYQHRSGRWGLFTRVVFSTPMLWMVFVYRMWVTRLSLR
jgi:ligand-binding SRPBCC domain-containing protein